MLFSEENEAGGTAGNVDIDIWLRYPFQGFQTKALLAKIAEESASGPANVGPAINLESVSINSLGTLYMK